MKLRNEIAVEITTWDSITLWKEHGNEKLHGVVIERLQVTSMVGFIENRRSQWGVCGKRMTENSSEVAAMKLDGR
jgi:hypothetical protein